MSGQGDAEILDLDPEQEARSKMLAPQLFAGMTLAQTELILVNVLQYIPSSDFKSCAEACPLWQSVIITQVGVPLLVGYRSQCWQPTVAFEHPSFLGRIATPRLTVSELTHPPDQVCAVKYPAVVKSLFIDGGITQHNISRIIGHPDNILVNLTSFAIDWSTMTSISLKGIAFQFPSLKTLLIWTLATREITIDNTDDNSWALGMENILVLLQQAKYPRLRKLFCKFLPIPTGQSAHATILAIVNFVIAHKSTLRKILLDFIGIEVELPQANGNLAQIDTPALLNACKGLSLSHAMVRCDEDIRGVASFKTLNLHQIITQSMPSLETGRPVGLESVYLDTGLYPSMASLSGLQQHQHTLKSIEMDVSLHDGAIDCSVFGAFIHLKVLTLIGRGHRVTRSDAHNPEILETPQLPIGLEALRLIRLRINKANADFIITGGFVPAAPYSNSKPQPQGCSNLTLVELQDIGQTEGLGLSLQAVEWAWENRKLKKLSICKAINLNSIDTQPAPGRTHTMGFMMLKQSLEADTDYAFGMCLRIHPQTGQPYYEMAWDEPIDEAGLWAFCGTDPILHFPSTPFNLNKLDSTASDGDDEDEEEMDDDAEDEIEIPVEGDAAEDAEGSEGVATDEGDDNDEEMDFEQDEEDEGGNGNDEDDWEPPQ